MLKMCRRFKHVMSVGQYFAVRSWNFGFSRMNAMLNDLERTQQNEVFPCDFTVLDWDDYISSYVVGIRTNILKDSLDTLPEARKKVQRYASKLTIFYDKITNCFFLLLDYIGFSA